MNFELRERSICEEKGIKVSEKIEWGDLCREIEIEQEKREIFVRGQILKRNETKFKRELGNRVSTERDLSSERENTMREKREYSCRKNLDR